MRPWHWPASCQWHQMLRFLIPAQRGHRPLSQVNAPVGNAVPHKNRSLTVAARIKTGRGADGCTSARTEVRGSLHRLESKNRCQTGAAVSDGKSASIAGRAASSIHRHDAVAFVLDHITNDGTGYAHESQDRQGFCGGGLTGEAFEPGGL